MRRKIYLPILLLAMLFLLICYFNVTEIEAGAIDQVAEKLKATLKNSGLSATLVDMARGLFITLASIQLAWAFIQLAADGKTDMQSIIAMLARQMLFIGFFYWWLNNGAAYFELIISSFQTKGKDISGVNSISEIFLIGITTADNLLKATWKITPWRQIVPVMLVVGFASLIILLSFATVTLIAITTLCKTYIACSVGVYFLGFGGNSYTKDIAINALKVCFISGVELFVTYILIGAGKLLFTEFQNLSDLAIESIYSVTFQILIAAFVYGGCVKTLPGFISGIVTGSSGSAGAGSAAIASGMMAAAGAAVGAAMTGGAMLAGGAIGGATADGGAMGKIGGAITGAYGAKKGSIGGFMRDQGIQQLKDFTGKGSNNSGGSNGQQNPNNVTPG